MTLKDKSKEELFAISLQRSTKTGNYTLRALKAQKILWELNEDSRYDEVPCSIGENGIVDRKYEELLYNGYVD